MIDIAEDVWEALRKTLTRYGTVYNELFFYFVPIATCAEQLGGSKVENWILRAFSDKKYCPQNNTFNDMKDGALKEVIGGYMNDDATRYYSKSKKTSDATTKVIVDIRSHFSKKVSHVHNLTLLSRKLLKNC
jgi:hypothetical protein